MRVGMASAYQSGKDSDAFLLYREVENVGSYLFFLDIILYPLTPAPP